MTDFLLARLGFVTLITPGAVFLIICFIIPVALLLQQSFFDPDFTFDFYRKAFSSPVYLSVFKVSFEIALVSTALSLLASYPLAFALIIAPTRLRALMLGLILLPFWTNILIRCYAWMLVLQTKGMVNSVLTSSGILSAPAELVFNTTGVLIGMTHYLIPINTLMLYSSMKGIDLQLLNAAKGLGADPLRAFVNVFFPLSLPALKASAVLVFVIALGFFVTPALLGGRGDITVAMLISSYFSELLNWGFGSALATLLLIFTAALLILYYSFQRDAQDRRAK
ncbi:MAG TPA: ABC transporter permease [Hyphomicrobiaceae bacterium]